MRRRPRILRRVAPALRQPRGEALVERLDRHVDDGAQRLEESFRRARLLAALAAKCQRQADDDALRRFRAHELSEPREPVLAPGALDDAERPRDGACGIGDRDAGACGAVVQREHLQLSAETISRSASASASPDDLLQLSDRLKQQNAPAAVVLGAREDGAAHLILNFDRSLESRGLDAGAVVKQAAALMGGGGGGRPTMARAGGKDVDKLPDALAEAERLSRNAL